ncbi:hypothetical protein ACJX0J_019058 [Zea mays]
MKRSTSIKKIIEELGEEPFAILADDSLSLKDAIEALLQHESHLLLIISIYGFIGKSKISRLRILKVVEDLKHARFDKDDMNESCLVPIELMIATILAKYMGDKNISAFHGDQIEIAGHEYRNINALYFF